ncbi:MAG TPA: hypothetical protein G4O08_05450 [Anaerolineae bacterium]|nr:hypothetical protein [Anaerolineae bacterium]
MRIARKPVVMLFTLIFVTLFGLGAGACGSISPPESCSNTGFDEAAFSEYFTEMYLINTATGEPGERDPEQGDRYATDDQIAVRIESLGEVEVRFCIEQRKGGGQIVYDQLHNIAQGESTVALTTFDSDPYVIRVIVNEALVRNLTFFTE